jgi:hypothetical protein
MVLEPKGELFRAAPTRHCTQRWFSFAVRRFGIGAHRFAVASAKSRHTIYKNPALTITYSPSTRSKVSLFGRLCFASMTTVSVKR